MGGPSSGERRRDNHIRSISWLFLGDGNDPAALPQPVFTACCRLAGAPGSPWLLALAANLGLVAWRRGESACLELPPARLPVAARLLGAAPTALGLDWRGGIPAPAWLEPLPGLYLAAGGSAAPPGLPPCRWRFQLDERLAAAASPVLALMEGAEAALPVAAGAPLFLLGLECLPVHRPGVTGIWGPLARHQLLDPRREGAPALRAVDAALARRYDGFLEALRAMPARRWQELPA
jgi:hypothetical protein